MKASIVFVLATAFTAVLSAQTDFASRTIRSQQGGTLELRDGSRVVVPADVLVADAQLSFSAVKTVAGLENFHLYNLTGMDAPLRMPAQVILHIPAPSGETNPRPVVEVLDQRDGWRAVPGFWEPGQGVMIFTDRIAPLRVSWEDRRSRSLEELRRDEVKPLLVPHYPQFHTPWCFAASAQMLLKYYGRDVEIWSIGREFRRNTENGAPAAELSSGAYPALFRRHGLTTENNYWLRFDSLNAYLMEQLQKRRPVFVALAYGRHAVVVTGYNHRGIQFHDPEGVMVEAIAGGSANLQALSHIEMTWDQWNLAVQGGLLWGIDPRVSVRTLLDPVTSVLAYTFAVTDGVPDKKTAPLTLAIASPREKPEKFGADQEFFFVRQDPDAGSEVRIFTWDGTQPLGYRFARSIGDTEQELSNSDTLFLRVALSNGGWPDIHRKDAESVVVVVAFDEREMVRVPVTFEKNEHWKSNKLIPIWWNASALKLQRLEQPLAPGFHKMKLRLESAGSVTDTTEVEFAVAPAQVQNVKLEKVTGAQKSMRVRWDENIEVQKKVAALEYVVSIDGRVVATTKKTEIDIDAPPGADVRVVATFTAPGGRKFSGFRSAKVEKSEATRYQVEIKQPELAMRERPTFNRPTVVTKLSLEDGRAVLHNTEGAAKSNLIARWEFSSKDPKPGETLAVKLTLEGDLTLDPKSKGRLGFNADWLNIDVSVVSQEEAAQFIYASFKTGATSNVPQAEMGGAIYATASVTDLNKRGKEPSYGIRTVSGTTEVKIPEGAHKFDVIVSVDTDNPKQTGKVIYAFR